MGTAGTNAPLPPPAYPFRTASRVPQTRAAWARARPHHPRRCVARARLPRRRSACRRSTGGGGHAARQRRRGTRMEAGCGSSYRAAPVIDSRDLPRPVCGGDQTEHETQLTDAHRRAPVAGLWTAQGRAWNHEGHRSRPKRSARPSESLASAWTVCRRARRPGTASRSRWSAVVAWG